MQIKQVKEEIAKRGVDAVFADAQACAKAGQEAWNAFVTICDADTSDLSQVQKNAPLYGVPVVLKDNVSTKGIRTTASSRILDNYIPVYDACIVERLKKAGALILAKASMDELGMGGTNKTAYTGPVRNPYDTARISGGSSGGSVVSVAGNVTALAIGSDTGDSIRKPASYCGVVGVKPTYGRISRYGIIAYGSSLDHVGYFTSCVSDAALALEVLAGRDDRDMTSSFVPVGSYSASLQSDLRGKRIAVLQNVIDAITDTAIQKQFALLTQSLQSQGAVVVPVELDNALLRALLPAYHIIANAEAAANSSNLDGIRFGMREAGENLEEIMMRSRTVGFNSNIRQRFVIGSYVLFVENQEKIFRKAQKVRRLIVNALADALADYDVLLAPAAGSGAPLIKDSTVSDQLSATYLIAENHLVLGNFSGYPSMTLPMGYTSDALPFGVNITAKPFAEQSMFDIGAGLEAMMAFQPNRKEGK